MSITTNSGVYQGANVTAAVGGFETSNGGQGAGIVAEGKNGTTVEAGVVQTANGTTVAGIAVQGANGNSFAIGGGFNPSTGNAGAIGGAVNSSTGDYCAGSVFNGVTNSICGNFRD